MRTAWLLDTNILLRLVDHAAVLHAVAIAAVARLLAAGHDVAITPQNVIEFWAVATRPLSANGLGWNPSRALVEVNALRERFAVASDTPDIFSRWLRLVADTGVSGRQVHDARLVAAMEAHSITHLLTFNVQDFRRYATITVIHPADVP